MILLKTLWENKQQPKPTKTTHNDWESLFSRTQKVQPEKTPNVPAAAEQPKTTPAQEPIKLKTASAAQTRAKMANMQPSPEITDKLSRIPNLPDEITDDEALRNAGIDGDVGTEVGFQTKIGNAVSN